MAENYKHIFLSDYAKSERYTSPKSMGGEETIPERNRISHSQRLLNQFRAIWEQKRAMEQAREAEQISTRTGTYLSFTSAVNSDLITRSLENLGQGVRLLNIQEKITSEEEKHIQAIVYVPNGKEGHFIKKLEKYQTEETKTGKPKNQKLVNSIEDVQIALLESFWIGKIDLMPDKDAKWCEVWLNINSEQTILQGQIEEFRQILSEIGVHSKSGELIFPERAVLLIYANRNQLKELMLRTDLLAELRIGQEPAGFWANESRLDQQEWVDDLTERIELADSNIKVCLLDSGVNNGHPLLQILIDDDNTLTVNSEWGTNDHEDGPGHGTLMAGVSGYGNLEEILLSDELVVLSHSLCSIKILPKPNQEPTPKELWGDITSRGVFISEIQNPEENLIYCLSITSKEDANEGRPSSWSGAIDNLTYGEGENQRLIIVSAGNLSVKEAINYPEINYVSSIQNPSQAWNALVVGAYTEKTQVNNPEFENYSLVAQKGELSPFSSTSNVWGNKWPVKPDVVFEGGNLLKSPTGEISRHEDLEPLSTSKATLIRHFDTINATSAAAAKASWFAAKIAYEYPEAWPETIRGLIVHSARWQEEMLRQMEVDRNRKTTYKALIRTFGYGVPDLETAIYSRESAFTFIAQETIQPFGFKERSKSKVETNEMHFYELPWPKELLLDLGETPVNLRITLSYFIEPGPGEIGWQDKYRYPSHGLRFDLINVGETLEDFQKRVNKEAWEEGERFKGNSGSSRWKLGSKNRDTGSIHSDFWEGTAADLADCNQIAIFPVIGWWRERKHLGKVTNQTRYSLIISLETPLEDVELYSTVKTMIKIPLETVIRT